MKIVVDLMSEEAMRIFERDLISLGYLKSGDAFWCKIYSKDGIDYILNREY